MQDTERLYLQSILSGYSTTFHAEVVHVDGDKVAFDRSLFYPLGGGQNWDTGIIKGPNGVQNVYEVRGRNQILHTLDEDHQLTLGDEIEGIIDWSRRHAHMRMHTAQHLVSGVVYELYNNHTSYHEGDSGLDLFVTEDVIVPKGALAFMINLQITCEAFSTKEKMNNVSYYLYPRSSMGSKTPLRLSNSVGIMDAGYRGNVIAIVDNIDREKDFVVEAGTRLVQLCGPMLESITFQLVNSLSETTRGEGGLGSTG